MADVTVKHIDDLKGYEDRFLYAAKDLGVTSWGMNVLKLPPQWADYPEHDHVSDNQEEVYFVIEGTATLQAGSQSWELKQGHFARLGPSQKRKIIPGDSGVTILALGGVPGKVYEPPSWAKA